nr:DUF4124 domain-containing protein [uncultured Desulfuromonas sp.]
MRRFVVCLCLVCLFPAMLVAGPLYKWIDENGVVHYSDRHPGKSANVKDFEDRSYPDARPVTEQEGDVNALVDETQEVAGDVQDDAEMTADVDETEAEEMMPEEDMTDQDVEEATPENVDEVPEER